MSVSVQTPENRPQATHKGSYINALLVVLLLAGALLYAQHAFQYYSYDDEEGYAYAAWRVSAGEVPYKDFLTPQMPAFLYWGGLIVRLFGRSYVALRLATMLVTLSAAYMLYALNRELYGAPVGLISMGLFMMEANVFHIARFFRPEAYMLLFDIAGLYAFVLGEKRGRKGSIWLASLLFGLAVLSKLFGALPLAGCFFYLLYAWWRERRPFKEVWSEGLALGIPAVVLVGTVALIFTGITPYFFIAVFEHHVLQGANLSHWQTIVKTLRFYQGQIVGQPVVLGLAVVGAISGMRREKAITALMLWQLPTALVFLALTRSLLPRHLTYLAPAVTTLAGVALWPLLRGHWRIWDPRAAEGIGNTAQRWGLGIVALVASLAAVYPWAIANQGLAQLKEKDSFALAATVSKLTTPDEYVMSDYPGINFLAGRRTTYWAAGISGGAAESGQVHGKVLIQELEEHDVAMVIINTLGEAHQMIGMAEYPEFRRYVQAHYVLVDKFHRGYQLLEVYTRQDLLPYKPNIVFQDQVELTGARLSNDKVDSGTSLGVALRWQALAKMPRDYSLSLRLVDASGQGWAQSDSALMEMFSHYKWETLDEMYDRFNTSTWEPQQVVFLENRLYTTPGMPPGRYYLAARVYEGYLGLTLSARAESTPTLSTGEAIIAPVQVARAVVPPRPNTLPISVTIGASLADRLDLLGSGPLPKEAMAGRALSLGLFWYAPQHPTEDYRLEYRLLQGEQIVQRWPMEIAAEYPASTWRDGEVVFGRYRLTLDETLREGHYSLRVAAIAQGGQVLGDAGVIADLAVKAKPDAQAIRQAINHPIEGIAFGGRIGLLGYDLAQETLKPGEELSLTLYWFCQQPITNSYMVFTHLLNDASIVQGQRDAVPGQGSAPTTEWIVGEVIVDHYEIPLQATAIEGNLQLEIGFYSPFSNERVPVWRDGQQTQEDHLILPTTVRVSR